MALVSGGETQYIVMQSAATATGNGTSVSTLDASNGAYTVIDMQVTGISGDTITFEATIDGTNWVAIACENQNDLTSATTATADGIYRKVIGGLRAIRARVSTYSAGAIYVHGSVAA